MKAIDLCGLWHVTSEDGSVNTDINLPGSACEAHIGTPAEYYTEYSKENVRAPRERYEYVGKLFYERKFDIPEEFEGLNLSLFFERVNFASVVWIDGIKIGVGVANLSTPHIYSLYKRLNAKGEELLSLLPGEHTIRLMVDNTNFLNLGDMASGYSVDTQGYWNGVVGKMELRAKPVCSIASADAFYRGSSLEVRTVTLSDRTRPMDVVPASLSFSILSSDGERLFTDTEDIELYSSRQRNCSFLDLSGLELEKWSEYTPTLYTVEVTLICGSDIDTYAFSYGFRTLEARNDGFLINGKPLSLRGTVNCAQFPKTGYPPMDTAYWLKQFKTFKEYGLNHVRFHAWCPPEAAFTAADKLGIYIMAEMPLWLNKDVTPMEFGDDDRHTTFFRNEGLRILEAYGNHPSFCFFSNGNENMGDYASMETMTRAFKSIDDRRLYTITSNFDHPLSPAEDFRCAFEIDHKRVRIQTKHDEVGLASDVDYSDVVPEAGAPVVSFEVGQYCVYPDVDICERYDGNMAPVNFDLIRNMMKEKGVYERLPEYVSASGDLAFKLYKEDIETALRTKGMGGFQLLSLTDYTGQSTATVGLLDVFGESKGICTPEEFRAFCNETVPLFAAKRIYKNTDILEAEVSLYDYSERKIFCPEYFIEFRDGGEILKEVVVRGEGKCKLSLPLDFVKKNTLIKVYITVKDGDRSYTNSWRIFVYKDALNYDDESEYIATSPKQIKDLYDNGGFLIATSDTLSNIEFSSNSFVPVFWSPAYFKAARNCGAMIQNEHPALAGFPSEKYLDYQWKPLFDESVNIELASVENADPIVEIVPNFVNNVPKSPLAEFNYGKGRVLFAGFDLSKDNPATQALKESLIEYAKSRKECF